jgi:hypothetical protein
MNDTLNTPPRSDQGPRRPFCQSIRHMGAEFARNRHNSLKKLDSWKKKIWIFLPFPWISLPCTWKTLPRIWKTLPSNPNRLQAMMSGVS